MRALKLRNETLELWINRLLLRLLLGCRGRSLRLTYTKRKTEYSERASENCHGLA